MTSENNVLREHEYQNKCELSKESFVSLATRGALVQTSCCGRRYERLEVESYIDAGLECPGCHNPGPELTAVIIDAIANETFSKSSSSLFDRTLGDISPFSKPYRLQSLDLSRCANICDISPLPNLTILQSLDLSGCDIPDIDLKSFERFAIHNSKQIDPTEHFSRYVKVIGLDTINKAIGFINPDYPVYSVGSGTGALEEYIVQQTGIKVICIDPDPDSWSDGHPVIRKPDYKYLKDVPEIPEDATLLLVAPNPGNSTYDMEAINAHKWKQIIIIGDKRGGAIGDEARAWLNEVCSDYNKADVSDNNDEEPIKKRDLGYSLKYQSTREACMIFSSSRDLMIYEIVVLEKDFKGEAVINKQKRIFERFERMGELLNLPFREFQKFYS